MHCMAQCQAFHTFKHNECFSLYEQGEGCSVSRKFAIHIITMRKGLHMMAHHALYINNIPVALAARHITVLV